MKASGRHFEFFFCNSKECSHLGSTVFTLVLNATSMRQFLIIKRQVAIINSSVSSVRNAIILSRVATNSMGSYS